ncbi:MAG: TIGR03960 family B12-binding radical SAM protein [Chloroflexi bacterium]|nr:TIGR03960 family B12-binding radical SAM protein [Chloroflexota bacterium]MDA8186641.1 TIGR03960 family B12-binding radical SAM protein [Dehalococcoidales bacterium]
MDRILRKVARPGRYVGGEWNSIVKDWRENEVRLALAYPDVYEIGMSNFGLQILYDLLNRRDGIVAERCYAPWTDMEAELRKQGIPLFSLESRRPLADFDFVGFSLSYELIFTNVLNMLNLAGIPLLAAERDARHPLVIAGGSACYNAEPMADFFDLFAIGEGEEVILDLVELYRGAGGKGADRTALLRQAATIPGIYVPSLYRVTYSQDGTVKEVTPTAPEASPVITRRIVKALPPTPTMPIVPFMNVVHDRAMIEIQRGCTRGCRFCQAGMIYRPVRERSKEEILRTANELLANTGAEELSLVSLSTSDHSEIEGIVRELAARHPNLNISLPSLRIDSFSVALAESIQRRKTGLTFAPEAGTQRLRDVINKGVTEDDLLKTAEAAYGRGWSQIKLYFMIGLPTETMEDVEGIVDLARKVKSVGRRHQGHRAQVSVSVATLIPKPDSPFQWVGQERPETVRPKQEYLKQMLRGIRFSWHDPESSLLEAALSRGDRRMGKVVLRAWQMGCKFDAWSEHQKPDVWLQAFHDEGLDPAFYAYRQRSLDEVLPWDHIAGGITRKFVAREYERSAQGELTPDCRSGKCSACGLRQLGAGC